MFEEATRNKYRFNSNHGVLSVEQLWELRLTSLKDIAEQLSNDRMVLGKKLEIVKHVIKVREEEVASHKARVKSIAEES